VKNPSILVAQLKQRTCEIKRLKERLERRQEALLSYAGWNHSCDFPDSCWYWVKVVRNKNIACSLEDALHIQEALTYGAI
jgi:hypothetical protein